jgi:hypothetical protein
VASFHQHGAQLKNFLSESAGTVLFCGYRVREGEGMESHIGYLLGIHLDLRFLQKARKKILLFLQSFFLKKIMVIHLLKRGEEIIYVFEDLKEAILKAMAEGLCIVRLRINEDGTVYQMLIYEPRIE